MKLRKILVASDFSPAASAALDCAAEFARRFDAEIQLLHVLPALVQYSPFPGIAPPPLEWLEVVRAQAKAHLAKEAGRIGGVKVATELRDGSIHECVLAAATASKADLIVLGTHGRRGFSHVLLGSVAERVVRLSPVPVLTVHPPQG